MTNKRGEMMKALILKNPITSSIIINLTGLIFTGLLLSKGIYGVIILCLPIVIVNKGILAYGVNINYKKKIVIYLSIFIMVITTMFYSLYVHVMNL